VVHETLREFLTPKSTKKEKVAINIMDRDAAVAVSPDGLTAQCRAEQWLGVRANTGVIKGKYYFEVTINDEGVSFKYNSVVAYPIAL
jgi:hypothetical protein